MNLCCSRHDLVQSCSAISGALTAGLPTDLRTCPRVSWLIERPVRRALSPPRSCQSAPARLGFLAPEANSSCARARRGAHPCLDRTSLASSKNNAARLKAAIVFLDESGHAHGASGAPCLEPCARRLPSCASVGVPTRRSPRSQPFASPYPAGHRCESELYHLRTLAPPDLSSYLKHSAKSSTVLMTPPSAGAERLLPDAVS